MSLENYDERFWIYDLDWDFEHFLEHAIYLGFSPTIK